MEKEKIFLDKDSYQQLLLEIDELKKELAANSLEKGEAYEGAAGDGWHDNFAFEEANRRERLIMGRLKDCYERLNRVVIVEKTNDEEVIDFGDIININMVFGPDDIENCLIELVGATNITSDNGIQQVSVNSPLGKSIYHKHIGEKTDYEVNGHKIIIELLSKENDKIAKAKSR